MPIQDHKKHAPNNERKKTDPVGHSHTPFEQSSTEKAALTLIQGLLQGVILWLAVEEMGFSE